jgi:circadian clock protein KaiB
MEWRPHRNETGPASGAPARWVLRLYVAGMSPHSARAIRTVKALCEAHFCGAYDLAVFDLYQDPALAERADVLATPTLDKLEPPPAVRLVGSLSDTDQVLRSLGVAVEKSG